MFDEVVTLMVLKDHRRLMHIYKVSGSKCIFLVLYVDDISLAANDTNMLVKTKHILFNHFDIKDLGGSILYFGHTDTS